MEDFRSKDSTQGAYEIIVKPDSKISEDKEKKQPNEKARNSGKIARELKSKEMRQSVKRRRFTVYTLWRLMINLKEVWRMTQLTLN